MIIQNPLPETVQPRVTSSLGATLRSFARPGSRGYDPVSVLVAGLTGVAGVLLVLAAPPVRGVGAVADLGLVALLLLLGRRGLVGRYLDAWFGVTLPFTTPAVVLAEAFVALPFLVLAVEGALRGADRRYEDAAATLGASRGRIFRTVTLPLIAPGITAGAVLCFAHALGEVGATVTFAGRFPRVPRTMPLEPGACVTFTWHRVDGVGCMVFRKVTPALKMRTR